ncbi:MAG TPA: hypothetical protein VFV99_19595, partial [Kofleriaceae bacterium]|nr:hypothetical protein [Kofleriaceae bacterium]
MADWRLGARVIAIAIAVAGCCPLPEADEPKVPPPPKQQAPLYTIAKEIPPAKMGHFEHQPPKAPVVPTNREMLKEPPLVPPAAPKNELPTRRETAAPPSAPTAQLDRLPDDVVMKLAETGRAAFVRCFKKAYQADPNQLSFKVRVHVELDGDGALTTANADTTDQALAGCLVRSLGWLKFPAAGKPV